MAIVRLLVICGASLVAAVVSANRGDRPWFPSLTEVRVANERPSRVQQIREAARVDARTLLERAAAGAVVIDARPAAEFEKGHFDALQHGAGLPTLNIPSEHVDEHLDRLNQLLMYTQELTLYCTSETCDMAEDLYIAIEERQLPFVMKIYTPGWEGIQKEGLSTAIGEDRWNGEDPDTLAALSGMGLHDPDSEAATEEEQEVPPDDVP